jgi:hypothetical protein
VPHSAESIVVCKKTGVGTDDGEKLARSLVPKTELAKPATEAEGAAGSWQLYQEIYGGARAGVEDDHELAWWPEVIEKAAGGVVSGLRRREGGKEMNGGARCQRWSGSNFATSATEVLRIATATRTIIGVSY